jgi:hypothetical protein
MTDDQELSELSPFHSLQLLLAFAWSRPVNWQQPAFLMSREPAAGPLHNLPPQPSPTSFWVHPGFTSRPRSGTHTTCPTPLSRCEKREEAEQECKRDKGAMRVEEARRIRPCTHSHLPDASHTSPLLAGHTFVLHDHTRGAGGPVAWGGCCPGDAGPRGAEAAAGKCWSMCLCEEREGDVCVSRQRGGKSAAVRKNF